INGTITDDKEFLEELINLTEFPTPVLCSFEDTKINIPDCIVESVVKDHMKALPITNKDGNRLLPYFIVIKNGTSDFSENVRKGYEKVVKAKVLDGEFFFNEDRKKRLSDRLNELEQVIFMRNLGSMKDKTNRLVNIGEHISGILKFSPEKKNDLKRAAMLSKCDLVTNIVKEFPELQGRIGGIYASLDGENIEVSRAIEEHYLPRSLNDRLPESELGKILSIIDRVDTIVGSILSSVEFSSSKDPFGIRKTASGITEILCQMNNTSYFPLKELIMKAKEVYFEYDKKLNGDINNVYSLIYDRTESFLRENGIDYDISNAVIKLDLDELPTFLERAKFLMKHRQENAFELLCQAHKRVRNILSKAEFDEKPVDNNYLFDESEIRLNNIINESCDLLPSLLASRDFEAVLHMFYLLNPEVKKFFENVLVMDENKKIRYNRLNLLLKLKNLYEKFASFSEIVINENKDKG
ncbi:MAG: glycine--tRNA ligase subunit beta, partial [Fervidobacterium sp.]